jgi:hypothetical protein
VVACARFDSLANHAIPGRLSESEEFSRFLDEHSGHGEVLSSVSVGDLYSSLLVGLWQLPGVIELPDCWRRRSCQFSIFNQMFPATSRGIWNTPGSQAADLITPGAFGYRQVKNVK